MFHLRALCVWDDIFTCDLNSGAIDCPCVNCILYFRDINLDFLCHVFISDQDLSEFYEELFEEIRDDDDDDDDDVDDDDDDDDDDSSDSDSESSDSENGILTFISLVSLIKTL